MVPGVEERKGERKVNEDLITKELVRFNLTDAAIGKLRTDYMALVVTGVDDKAGCQRVHDARMDIVRRRTSIEKTRKDLKADSLEYGRRVDAEAKRLTALLAPIEDHLGSQEKIVLDEITRRREEAARKEAERVQARVNRLFDFGARFDGQNYSAMGLMIPAAVVKSCTDEQFEQFCGQVQAKVDEEKARAEAEEATRKAEAGRLAKIAAEQEAERKRLAEQRAEQERVERLAREERQREEERLRAEREAIEAEKKRLADAEAARLKAIEDEKRRVEEQKRRAEELERAKAEAAEKARREEAERIEREAKARAEREEKERLAKERKEARRPDREKLLAFADMLANIEYPKMKTSDGEAVLLMVKSDLEAAINSMKAKAEAM